VHNFILACLDDYEEDENAYHQILLVLIACKTMIPKYPPLGRGNFFGGRPYLFGGCL
jgi:hypothetical protein